MDMDTAPVELSDDDIEHLEGERSKTVQASDVENFPDGEGRTSWKRPWVRS